VPALAAAVIMVAALLLSAACSSGESKEAPSSTAVKTRTSAPTPSPTTTFPESSVRYTVKEGDTVFDIAQQYGVTVEAIVAANHLPDATTIDVGQVLIIPNPSFTPGATLSATTPAPDPRLTGFTYPIAGACLPTSDNLMPNAPREYRAGIHEGIDFYTGYNCAEVPANTNVLAAKAGTVTRADHNFVPMTLDELNATLARTQAQGYTDEDALDKFRGRQVWIDHGSGIVTRYAHLAGIPDNIVEGTRVSAGDLVGFVGDSGTPESITDPGVEIHLHWELRVGDSFLGAGLAADVVRSLYERLFAP
ncbi:MAG TPA: M23 family metallopeptidase, partial [Dehalococcoidia bacterium]|nr:M23 family metallopeptidase [Dehalococcoidia bacterium]